MLHCNMAAHLPLPLHLDLEDVLGNLQYARRTGDLGRLVHLTYWDVRKWARWAHRDALAERAADLIRDQPHPSRSALLTIVDDVISELERIRVEEVPEARVGFPVDFIRAAPGHGASAQTGA
jgi:hypothetical protein